MLRLVQIFNPAYGRRVAVVEDDQLELLETFSAIYDFAKAAARDARPLEDLIDAERSKQTLAYDPIYQGQSDWKLLPAFDHPEEPARCLVSGTGLTHKASADNRKAMHDSGQQAPAPNDSIRMYEWGLAGGRPAPGDVGVMPEWFYKGSGLILLAHGDPLPVPEYGEDGGEEPEIAGAYIIDHSGAPRRVGLVTANEFSDHKLEKRNYLYLAPSKLRSCAIGPELVVTSDFGGIAGTVSVERGGKKLWSKEICTGEATMCHSLANLEHHHFKYSMHRRPGDAHVHFFGADAFSFGAGIALQHGDVMEVQWQGMGRALRNPIAIEGSRETLCKVTAL